MQEFTADLALYGHAAGTRDKILVVGCGNGRILKHLLDMGHPVTAVDIADDLMDTARTKLQSYVTKGVLKLVLHDFDQGPLGGSFTLGLVPGFYLNLVLDNPERFLKNLADSLFAHHTLMLDLFYPKVLHSPSLNGQWSRETMLRDGKTVTYLDKRSWNAKKHLEERVQVFEEGGHKQEIVTQRRYWSTAAIHEALTKVGFTDIAFCRGFDGHWQENLLESSLAGNFVVRAKR